MNRQSNQSRQKPAVNQHQRQNRRNQIIVLVFSGVIILSMILSLFVNP